MEDLIKAKKELLKHEKEYLQIQQDIEKCTSQYNNLITNQVKLKEKFHRSTIKLLSKIFTKLKINLYEHEDIYLYIVGFIYAIKSNMLTKDQLDYFKLLGSRYLNQKSR